MQTSTQYVPYHPENSAGRALAEFHPHHFYVPNFTTDLTDKMKDKRMYRSHWLDSGFQCLKFCKYSRRELLNDKNSYKTRYSNKKIKFIS